LRAHDGGDLAPERVERAVREVAVRLGRGRRSPLARPCGDPPGLRDRRIDADDALAEHGGELGVEQRVVAACEHDRVDFAGEAGARRRNRLLRRPPAHAGFD